MRRVLLAVAAATVVLFTGAAPAFADSLTIRKVDTTRFPKVVISALATGKTPGLGDFQLRENGRLIDRFDVTPLSKTSAAVGTVLTVDTSGSMKDRGKIEAAKAAAHRFVAGKLPTDVLAVVGFNSRPTVVANFTADNATLDRAIDGLAAGGETALWDGIRAATALFADRPELQPNVVVLSDGKDTVSTSSFDDARSAAVAAHAAVFTAGLQGGDFDPAPLKQISDATGAQALTTADPAALTALYGTIQRSIQNQYEISYQSRAEGVVDLDLTAAGQRANAKVSAGSVAQGAATRPEEVVVHRTWLQTTTGRFLIGLMVLVAAGLAVYALLTVFLPQRSRLESVLSPYGSDHVDEDDDIGDRAFAETAIVQRAVAATGKFAGDRGMLQRFERMLEEADVPLRGPEALFFGLAAAVVGCALMFFMSGSAIVALLALVLLGCLPVVFLRSKAALRRRKFTSQLPDTLQLLAGSLRAGYSLMQGVEAVAQEVDDPMGQELRRILAESRLGRVLEDAMDDTANRMKSPDFDWAVMAVRIQREVGGNLSELLTTVTETMRARERLRREVKALTAEGRISAVILGIMPLGIGLALYLINPVYMTVLFHRKMGLAMLGASGVLLLFGFWWMKKTIEVEV